MKELTDVQYREIGRAAEDWSGSRLEAGRAAYIASFPHAVAEALAEPSVELRDAMTNAATEITKGWIVACDGKENIDPPSLGGVIVSLVIAYLRECHAVIAKPDPAVEAVAAICKEYDAHTRYEGHQEFIAKIVAAVDAARAK